MLTHITNVGPKVGKQDITQFELNIGYPLPDVYKEFLLRNNGGTPEPDAFFIEELNTASLLHFFLSVNAEQNKDLLQCIHTYKNRVPYSMMPIAYDVGGNLVCIGISGNDKDKIYFWDHEEEAEEGESPSQKNVYLIAKSFPDFLNNIGREN